MNNKGFFLLENIIVYMLGTLLLLSTLRIYDECLLTMQKKLQLEKAIETVEANLYYKEDFNKFKIIKKDLSSSIPELNLKEMDVYLNEKLLLSIAFTE